MTTLTLSTLQKLMDLSAAVFAGQPITYGNGNGWGIARAFTYDGGGFLRDDTDVRDGYVWLSGGSALSERWLPVSVILDGLTDGTVALNYRPV